MFPDKSRRARYGKPSSLKRLRYAKIEGDAFSENKIRIQEMAVFGSAARGDMRPDSDVGIMIEFFPEIKYCIREYQSIEDELADAFADRST
jgi:predicted nucleotidyltransferase